MIFLFVVAGDDISIYQRNPVQNSPIPDLLYHIFVTFQISIFLIYCFNICNCIFKYIWRPIIYVCLLLQEMTSQYIRDCLCGAQLSIPLTFSNIISLQKMKQFQNLNFLDMLLHYIYATAFTYRCQYLMKLNSLDKRRCFRTSNIYSMFYQHIHINQIYLTDTLLNLYPN